MHNIEATVEAYKQSQCPNKFDDGRPGVISCNLPIMHEGKHTWELESEWDAYGKGYQRQSAEERVIAYGVVLQAALLVVEKLAPEAEKQLRLILEYLTKRQ